MRAYELKPARRMVKLGDVVRQCKEKVDRDGNPFERYVEGGHMDSEDVHIRRWGEFGQDYVGPAFHRVFRKGQILYGSRRTYLKKVAVAEFDGITANTTFVLETKDQGVFMQELLPFLMLTDRFTEHSIGESKGSTNPYINYPDIAKFEFPLPPIEEQKRIAEILWAADDAVETFMKARESLVKTADVYAATFLNQDWKTESLGQLLEQVQYGSSKRIEQRSDDSVPILRIPNVLGGKLVLDNLGYTNLSSSEEDKYQLAEGDVLIVRTNGNPGYVGRTAVVNGVPDGCVYASYLIRLRPKTDRILPKYLHAALSSSSIRKTLRHEIRSSAGNYNLNTKGIKRQILPIPPLPEQREFVEQFDSFMAEEERITAHADSLLRLRKATANREIGAVLV